MDLWDGDAVNFVGEAFINIEGRDGETRFIAVTAWFDNRYGARSGEPFAEFSWRGVDDGDQRSGRGWPARGAPGTRVGRIFFHNGDDSGFICEPW